MQIKTRRNIAKHNRTYRLLNLCLGFSHRISTMASSLFFTHSHCYSSSTSSSYLVSRLHRQLGVAPTSLRLSSSHVVNVGMLKLLTFLSFLHFLSLPIFYLIFGFWGLLGSILFPKKKSAKICFCFSFSFSLSELGVLSEGFSYRVYHSLQNRCSIICLHICTTLIFSL